MKAWIVIPNWNGAEYISAALRSLRKQSQKAKIVVVDNGSVDDSVKTINRSFPDVELIELEENIGFAGGVNAGIKHAINHGAEFIALFNNDALADKNWLKSLLKRMESDKKIGIVSCKQLRSDKKHIDSTGDYYSIWGLPFPRGRNHVDTDKYDTAEEVPSAPAGATLYRVELFKDIGLFDEAFFAYYEDVDISLRAQLARWKVFYEPSAVVYHKVSATSDKLGTFTRFHATKNIHMLFLKIMPGRLFWQYFPLAILQSGRLALGALAHGQLLTHIKGYFAAVKLIPYTIKERRRIQELRKISVSDFDQLLYHGRPPKIPELPQD